MTRPHRVSDINFEHWYRFNLNGGKCKLGKYKAYSEKKYEFSSIGKNTVERTARAI